MKNSPAAPGGPAEIEVRGATKNFGPLRALDEVSLTVRRGSFHAVVGENGAGKSTLAKAMLGVLPLDSGEVKADGNPVHTPAAARHAGIGMVFQQFRLVPSMTVAENLLLARADLPAVVDRRKERSRLDDFLATAPFAINLDSRVAHLAAGQKQKVEILKQLYLKTRVLILDEPTSVLTLDEAKEVMTVLSAMVRSGSLSVVLISHRFPEVMDFADEVTVLRGGRCVGTQQVKETSPAKLAALMMGDARAPETVHKKPGTESKQPVFELRSLTVHGPNGQIAVNGVSLGVSAGEILGIAGVAGNGQRELVEAVAGQRTIENGAILAFGHRFHPTRKGIRAAGLFTLPEEPLENATVPSLSLADNLALRRFDCRPFARWHFLLDRKAIRDAAIELIQNFSIRPPSPSIAIRNLSGGNLRKAVVGRDLSDGNARILVVANPTVGLDFAATASVHNRLIERRNNGAALLLISEDLDELVQLSDRIAVMSRGEIVHETSAQELDRATVGAYFAGG